MCFRGESAVDGTERDNANNADDDDDGTLYMELVGRGWIIGERAHVDIGACYRGANEELGKQEIKYEGTGTKWCDIF